MVLELLVDEEDGDDDQRLREALGQRDEADEHRRDRSSHEGDQVEDPYEDGERDGIGDADREKGDACNDAGATLMSRLPAT